MNPTIIQNKIYEVRGQKVMLDFDLAELYNVETRRLNEQVGRNAERFPKDFMFQVTQNEFENLMSQNATSSWGGRRKLPFAFTEHGVTMLASILRSERAIKMNIAIVRAFIGLRQVALNHKDLAEQLGQLRQELYERIGEHDTQLAGIYEAIENLLEEKTEKKNWENRERIGFKKT